MATLVLARLTKGSFDRIPLPTDHPLYGLLNEDTVLPRRGSTSLTALAEACLSRPVNDYKDDEELSREVASATVALLNVFTDKQKVFINQYKLRINGALLRSFEGESQRPERFSACVNLSVPFQRLKSIGKLDQLRKRKKVCHFSPCLRCTR